jgi:hypothetical protein
MWELAVTACVWHSRSSGVPRAGKPDFFDEDEDLDALLQEAGMAPTAPEPKKADKAQAVDDDESDDDEPGGTVWMHVARVVIFGVTGGQVHAVLQS